MQPSPPPAGMTRRLVRIAFAVAIGLAILSGAIWILTKTLGTRQTLYQGKSAYEWGRQSKAADATVSNQAIAVLNAEIIPQLTQVLFSDTNDSSLRVALVENLNALPGINIFFATAAGRRASAAQELGEFGPQGKAAIPALLQAVKGADEAVRGPAIRALGRIGGQPDVVIPLLIGLLDDKDVNDEAAEALGNFGVLSKEAVPKLILMLKIPDKELHYAVETALKKIDPEAAAQAGVR